MISDNRHLCKIMTRLTEKGKLLGNPRKLGSYDCRVWFQNSFLVTTRLLWGIQPVRGLSSMLEDIQGQIERVTFHNDENGFTIARLKVKGFRELVTAVGNLMAPVP